MKKLCLKECKLKWKKAMKSKMDLLHKNSMWELVHLPTIKRVLPCKWVYKTKATNNEKKTKYIRKLVAKGFKQQKGANFKEFFSSTIKITTLYCVLALVVVKDIELV